MNSSAPSPRLPSAGPRHNLPLPNELILKIFHELVLETGSSASLAPSLSTCVAFHNILVGEPELWTRLCADMTTANLSGSKSDISSFWPHLQTAIRLSQNHPISLVVNLATDHPLQSMITRDHLWALTFAVLCSRRTHERCEELIVRCSNWSNMCDFMQPLVHRIRNFPHLRRLELQYVPSPPFPESHPGGDEYFVSLLDASYPIYVDDVEAKRRYNDRTFPNLRQVVLCNIASNFDSFAATRLTSFRFENPLGSLSQIQHEEVQHMLMINSDTLTTVELGLWGVGWVQESYATSERYTLSVLEELKVSIPAYRDFGLFVETLDLPSLKRLGITDDCHRSNVDGNQIADLGSRTNCLEAYMSMMELWPLHQVTHLALTSVVIYEMEGNRVSLLQPSHEREEIWEEGLPLATQFFYKFSSLQQLEVEDVDMTTEVAMTVPPRIYNPTTGTFYGVVLLFPLLRRLG
ncbi:hypothetical protein L218DRAFT_262543 [Marasmius fiardii PR-910]|nr:hypothetical protein L218DRAFT_262543 [Marasmius fiardii PR-910]